jgi:hypothetical protein
VGKPFRGMVVEVALAPLLDRKTWGLELALALGTLVPVWLRTPDFTGR